MTVREHAARIVDGLDPDLRRRLAAAPLDALTAEGLSIAALEDHGHSRSCDGMSTTEGGIVLYLATPDSRRENFTLLHEYAHTLVDNDMDAMLWLSDQPDVDRTTEQLCNEIASRLLVPAGTLDAIVGSGPIRAEHLQNLHRETEASQSAIAVALARRLTAIGAVLLIDRSTQRVVQAALVGDPAVWPWKNQTVPDGHPLRRIQPGDHQQSRSWWATPWGERQTYYLDATASAKRVYAVLAATDLWHVTRFHGGDVIPERQQRPSGTRSCPCGYEGRMTGWPCEHCHVQFCPKCGNCLCDVRNARATACRACGLSFQPTALLDGLCSDCR